MLRDDVVLAVLNRLETENRRLKRVLTAVLSLFVVLTCTAMVWQDKNKKKKEPVIQNLLRTRRLELANANGRVVAVLQAVEKEAEPGWLTEYHDNGRRKWRAKIKNNR